jgi:hypothetical protein
MPSAAKGAGGCCLVERKVRMVWPRRAIGVIFAMAVAIGAGLVFLPVAALADPVTRAAGFALIQFAVWALADADIADGLNGGGLPALTRFVWMAVMTVCAVPVVAVASLGELARVRCFPGMPAPPASLPRPRHGSSAQHCICQEQQAIISRNCGLPLFSSLLA